ncbi:putative Calcineurin-like phosphoesterase [Blattamonas nauphoetae]|uniref:protein-serine/threonine phosphatase n=1 Tax=Blattamonas nauphoetae TaxID=2049346 RepID=A0ABQ9XFD8_9EUKA|nr:putative Calcineurin-like phosphoesterase [Blattamonas nauphoetae]
MWRHFNDTPIPSLFKQTDLFGNSTSIDMPALCPSAPSPNSSTTTLVKNIRDDLASSKGVASHIDLLHVRDYSQSFPFLPLRLFHLLPKPDEPPLSEFRDKPIDPSASLPLQRGLGDPMERFCPTHTLKLDAQSFSTYSSSFNPPPMTLQKPFTPLRASEYCDTIHPRTGLRYSLPIGHPSFPFYSPFAVHSALPVPYSSPLEPVIDSISGNRCLITHAQEKIPDFEGRLMGSVTSCDNLNPDSLCSDLLSQHPAYSYPLLLFLVPAQLHLYPVHTPETPADEIVLNGMVQQDPTFSLPRSQAVDGAELFNSVAGVLTQGRRILSQSVFSATEDWHYVLDKLNSIIRPTIEKVQVDFNPYNPADPHRPIVTMDRMNGSGVDVRAFVTGRTFGELALLNRRPTVADVLLRSSSRIVKQIKGHPEVEALTLKADLKAQLILRLPPPRDQKLKYLQLLRVAAHLNHVAPVSGQNFTRLTAASLLPQFSSHFDIPLHSQDKPRFKDFIERFIDFIVRVLLVEVKTLAELANAGKNGDIVVRLSNATQPVNEPTLVTAAPQSDAIADFAQTMILSKPKSVEGFIRPVDQIPVPSSAWEGTEAQVDESLISSDVLNIVDRDAAARKQELEKKEEEIERKREAEKDKIIRPEPELIEDGPMMELPAIQNMPPSMSGMMVDRSQPSQHDVITSLDSASITPALQTQQTAAPKPAVRRKKRPPVVPTSGEELTQLDNESGLSIVPSERGAEKRESEGILLQIVRNPSLVENDEVVELEAGNVYGSEQTDESPYGEVMERQENDTIKLNRTTRSVFQTKVVSSTATSIPLDWLASKSQLNLQTLHLPKVSYLQLFQPVLLDLITLLEEEGDALSKQHNLFPVSQITDEKISDLNDHAIAGRFVFAELKPRSRLFAPAISETHFNSLDRIIKKLINTYPVLNVLTLHELYVLWLRHNEEIASDTNNQIWEENRLRITQSLHTWIRHCLIKLDNENKDKYSVWISPTLQSSSLEVEFTENKEEWAHVSKQTMRDYFVVDVAAHLYTLLPFDITPADIDGFIEEEEERTLAEPGSFLQFKEKGDNFRMKLVILQMLAEYETRLPLFGMHLPTKFQTEHYPAQNPPVLSPITANHNPCLLWDLGNVMASMRNQEEVHAAREQLIRRLKRTMNLLQLADFQPIFSSSDGSERASVSSLLVQTPTNPFTDNLFTPDIFRWCVARKAVWQNNTIMERHQPRHAPLVPCHSHCLPVAKIVASGFPIYATFHHHNRYVPSLTHNRDCQALDLPVEPRPLILDGRQQVLTQTYFLCSSPTALSRGFSTIFDPRRFVSFPSHIHGGAKWILNFGRVRSEDYTFIDLPDSPEAVQAMTPERLHAIRMHMQALCNGHNLDDMHNVRGLHYKYGHVVITSHDHHLFGSTMTFFTINSFYNFVLLAQKHLGFYYAGQQPRPGTTDGVYRGVEEVTLECGDVTQVHQPSDVVGQESVRGLFVVGDIHGNLNAALCSCDVIDVIVRQPPGQAAIVFCGDFIDRGSYSFEVLTLLLIYRMRFPQHVFILHGNHESSYLTRETDGESWNKYFHEKFSNPGVRDHPFTQLLRDLFKAMPSALLCTLRHTSLQNTGPVIEERRVLCVHGGLSSVFPIPNLQQVIDHPPIMDDSENTPIETTREMYDSDDSHAHGYYNFFQQWSERTQHFNFHRAASYGDPYGADEPWEGRNRFSPITTRAFMAANRIDLIMRGHESPAHAEGTVESHDGAVITSFGAFDYDLSEFPAYSGPIPAELGQHLDPRSFLLDNQCRVESTNGAMQWLCLQSITSNTVDPVLLVQNARSQAALIAHSRKRAQKFADELKTHALAEQISNPTSGFTFTTDQTLARAATLPKIVAALDEKQLESEATLTSAIVFTMKTIHLDSLAKILDSAPK